jgi:hypothetical protein
VVIRGKLERRWRAWLAWLGRRLPTTPLPHGRRFLVRKKRGWVLTPRAIKVIAVLFADALALLVPVRRLPYATSIDTGRRRLRFASSLASRPSRLALAGARRETFSTSPAQNIDMMSDVPP